MSALPTFTIRELLEAGVHYGHKTMRWNPKMAPYLFGSRNGTHIIDLQQTAPMFHQALKVVYDVVKANGRVLFVGTKRQASDPIAEAAKRCGQYYVNHRWLGGMLTNWKTVSQSIKTLRETEAKLEGSREGLKKKEILSLERRADKLKLSLGGILEMGGKPDLLFIIDTNKESLAMQEAKKLGVPVIAIVDSNSNPDDVNFPIPGNDDAIRSITLYCQLISDAALAGIQDSLGSKAVADLAEEKKDVAAAKNDNAKSVTKKAEKEVKPVAKKATEKKVEEPKKSVAKVAAKKTEDKPAAKKAEAKKTAAEPVVKKAAEKKDDGAKVVESKKAAPKKVEAEKKTAAKK